ncbi:MAG TPA: hypothetical protein VKV04_20660 [Verrucomicrobiae bacterium]|nr:hypothetical protein [Verrucomicrobiae bacterium]
MSQHTGALLDKLFMIGAGLFALLAPPSLFLKKGDSQEAISKRVKTMRICGVLMTFIGIITLLLALR